MRYRMKQILQSKFYQGDSLYQIAKKYNKPTKVKKDDHITGEYKNEIQIILDDEDVFEPYVGTEPTVRDYTAKYGKVAMRKKSQDIA